MEWFRFYSEALADRKLRRLSCDHRWLWVALLSIASESPERGVLMIAANVPATLQDIQDVAAVPLEEVEAGLIIFERQGMISREATNTGETVYVVTNWDKRQFASDSSTARSKKHREAKRDDQGSTAQSESDHCNVPATVMQRSAQRSGNAPDTESEAETECVSTAREIHGHLAGVRAEGAGTEWAGQGEPVPPPDTDPFDGRDAKQQQETAARQEAGRRNQPITALFVAFRRGKWPHKPAEWHETYPAAELREAFETLRALHQDGVTPEQMQAATERCLVEYSNPTRVTIDAIARAWTTLTEPPPKVIGAKSAGTAGAAANGVQQTAPRSARRLVQ